MLACLIRFALLDMVWRDAKRHLWKHEEGKAGTREEVTWIVLFERLLVVADKCRLYFCERRKL